ncbi:D-2-hydroxyacid dehydrogenase [Cytospora mali]|uniref:D-2-hydroxyacid dehydrogenase n=1 Tax=Cytospora mali TaxID=578113 RepID=A0A194VNK8_CYTMA|nr:D-2-hydroxyacid dehydrogenase [Valsa mali]
MIPLVAPPANLLKSVRFVLAASSGLDRWIGHPTYNDPNVLFANARGGTAPEIAEWVMGTWLAHGHHLYEYHDLQKKGEWETWSGTPRVQDSHGQRIGVLGYGAIGRQVGLDIWSTPARFFTPPRHRIMASTNNTRSDKSGDILLAFFTFPPPEEWIHRMKANHPGLEVRWTLLMEGTRLILPEDNPPELWDGVTILMIPLVAPPANLLKSVRFVLAASSGLDRWIGHPTYNDPNVLFANARGGTAPEIAEWVMGTWLAHGHHLYEYHDLQKKGEWETWSGTPRVQDSHGQRIGVLGYGAIGRQVGRIANALGMEVYAYTRSERPTPESRRDNDYIVPGMGDPEGTIPSRWFHGESKESLREFLSQDLDMLAISIPLSETNGNLISHEEFEILARKKTFVSNISRGQLINTQALISALEKGQIRGAALDVTDPEPLPHGHPLWEAPNLFISPHVSWQSDKFFDRVWELLDINIGRLREGKEPLNLVKRNFTG